MPRLLKAPSFLLLHHHHGGPVSDVAGSLLHLPNVSGKSSTRLPGQALPSADLRHFDGNLSLQRSRRLGRWSYVASTDSPEFVKEFGSMICDEAADSNAEFRAVSATYKLVFIFNDEEQR